MAEPDAPGIGPVTPPPPRRGDPKPQAGKAKTRKRYKAKVDDGLLAETLGRMLSMPAIPAKMFLHCDFCTLHFTNEGPKAAGELVELSKDHPQLRGALEDMYKAYTSITWAGVIAGYAAKPAMHHLAPAPVLDFVGPFIGVPSREPKTAGEPGPGGIPADAMAAAAEMVGNMSEEEMMQMAAQMGLAPTMAPEGDNGSTPADQAAAGESSAPGGSPDAETGPDTLPG